MNLKVFIPGENPVAKALRQILDTSTQVGEQTQANVVIVHTETALHDYYILRGSSPQQFVLFGSPKPNKLLPNTVWIEGSLVSLLNHLETVQKNP